MTFMTPLAACDYSITPVGACHSYAADSLDLRSWHFEGDAYWEEAQGWVALTGPGPGQSGTAFQTATPVDASEVRIDFEFYIGDGTGADGLSVTALDVQRMDGFVASLAAASATSASLVGPSRSTPIPMRWTPARKITCHSIWTKVLMYSPGRLFQRWRTRDGTLPR